VSGPDRLPHRTVVVFSPSAAPSAAIELLAAAVRDGGAPLAYTVMDSLRADAAGRDVGLRRFALAAKYVGFDVQLTLIPRSDGGRS
jgi:hypothetical protein